MTKQEFTGKSLDEALDTAAKTLGVEKSALSYNILPAAQSGGLLSKLFSRSVRIEAWNDDAINNAAREAVRQIIEKKNKTEPRQPQPENTKEHHRREKNKSAQNQPRGERVERSSQENRQRPEKQQRKERTERRPDRRESQSREPREPRPDRSQEPPRPSIPLANPDVQALFDEYKGVFLKTFSISNENFSKTDDESGNWTVSIQDAHIEDQLARSDKLAVAFEHLFKRLAQKKVGDVGGRIYLTSGQAEEKRQEALREFAFSLAEKVKRTGRSITVSSKTSQERRVIHLTLDGQPGIATRSVGSGERRKLIVYPTGPRQNRRVEGDGEQQSRAAQNGEEGEQRRNRRRGRRGRGHGKGQAHHQNDKPETEQTPPNA